MERKKVFIQRLLWIPVNLFILHNLISLILIPTTNLARNFFYIWGIDFYIPNRFAVYQVFIISASWAILLLIAEIMNFRSDSFRFENPRFLKNLRMAPPMIFFISLFAVQIFDLAMIQYSKSKVKSYVYQKSNNVYLPEVELHSDYRGWCGNGYTARVSELYFDAAAEGIDDARPAVRARSLLMTDYVQDFLNDNDEVKIQTVYKKACLDGSVEMSLALNSSVVKNFDFCQQILSK